MKLLPTVVALMSLAATAWAQPACEFDPTDPDCVQLCTPDRVPTILGRAIPATAVAQCTGGSSYTNKADCEAAGSCSAGATYTTEASCDAAAACTDTTYTTQAACEAAADCRKPNKGQAVKYTTKKSCESNYKCTPPGKTAPDPNHCCANLAGSQSECTTDATCTGCGWHAKNVNNIPMDWTPEWQEYEWTPSNYRWYTPPTDATLSQVEFNQLANWSVRCDCRPGTQEVYYDATTKLMTTSPTSVAVANGCISHDNPAGCSCPNTAYPCDLLKPNPRAGTCTSEAITYQRPEAQCSGSLAPFVFECSTSMTGAATCGGWDTSNPTQACLASDPPCADGYAKNGTNCAATPLRFTGSWPPSKVGGTTRATNTCNPTSCTKGLQTNYRYGVFRIAGGKGASYEYHTFPDPNTLPAPRCPAGSINNVPDANGDCEWVIPADSVHSEWKKEDVLGAATKRFSVPQTTYSDHLAERYPRIKLGAHEATMRAEREALEATYQSALIADDQVPSGGSGKPDQEGGIFDSTVFPNRHMQDIRPDQYKETDIACPAGFTSYQQSCRVTLKASVPHPQPLANSPARTFNPTIPSGFVKGAIYGTNAPTTVVGYQVAKCIPAPYGWTTTIKPVNTYSTIYVTCKKWNYSCNRTKWDLRGLEYWQDCEQPSSNWCKGGWRACTRVYTKKELHCRERTTASTAINNCASTPYTPSSPYGSVSASCRYRPTGDGNSSPQEYWHPTSYTCVTR